MDSIALAVATIHLAVCPFTKVEESFNLQAMHDIFYHNINISAYDHLEFPGVVPRTFLGPLCICLLSSPFYFLVDYFQVSKFSVQLLVRCVLGASVIFSWNKFKSTIEYLFGEGVARWLLILTVSQFHFMFYLSRPLPNILALPFVLFALHAWLRKQHTVLILMSGISVVIFRAELVLFLGLLLLFELFYRRLSFTGLFLRGVPIGIMCLATTVGVDSFFWQRLLWPEGEVLYFNTMLNGSVDYGTHPFLWYFYSALPRAMGASLLFIPSSLWWDKRIRRLVTPALAFIVLYSCLPHKELRFIIYSFPVLNVAAAYTCNLLWTRRTKSFLHKCVALGILTHVVVNFAITYFLLSISSHNYPGGVAISTLHKIEPPTEPVNVHIDNYAAQTGVSRFTQLNPAWTYNKTEFLKPGGPELMAFTHLIVEAKSKYSPNLKPYVKTHNVISIVETFSHLQFNYVNYLHNVVTIKTRPSLFILKRKDLMQDPDSGAKSSKRADSERSFDRNSRERSRSPSSIERGESEEKVVIGEASENKEQGQKSERSESRLNEKYGSEDSRSKGEDSSSRASEDEDVRKPRRSNREETVSKINEAKNKKESKTSNTNEKYKENGLTSEEDVKTSSLGGKLEENSNEPMKSESKEKSVKDTAEEKLVEESVRENIKTRLKANIKESLQSAKEKRRGKGERDETGEKILLPINMDELSKGDFVGAKFEEEVCTNCHGRESEEIEVVRKQEKEEKSGGNGKVNSIREDIKKKILKMRLKLKMEEGKNRVDRESSDEYINVEDE